MLNTRYVMVLMLVLAMILAACNGDDEEEDDNNTTATTAPAGDATEAPAAGDATTEAPAADATTEAPAADATGEAGATGALATDAEAAIVAYLSGDFAEAQTYFCADVATQIEAAGSAAASVPTPATTPEYEADCSESGGTVTCEVVATVGGAATPAISYSMTATDGQLCGLPTPVQ